MITTHPIRTPLYPKEEVMCRAFMQLVRNYQQAGLMHPMAIHAISNNQRGGKKSMVAQAKDKAIGVIRGVADYYVPGRGYLEAKIYRLSPSGRSVQRTKQTPEQRAFEEYVTGMGEEYRLFYTPQEGIDILRKWGVLHGGEA